MWASIAKFILNNRIVILLVILLITVFMGFHARKAEIIYEPPRLLPENDTTIIEYKKFKNLFGQDGGVMVIGIEDENIYNLENFNSWFDLGNNIKKIKVQ